MPVDYDYGFINPMAEPHRPLRPEYDTFEASKRPRHGGLDLYPVMLPARIIVPADGKVRFVGQGSSQAGWLAEILHPAYPGWYLTRSMHMVSHPVLPAAGTPVDVGDLVGMAGATGNANAVHNHFEIRHASSPEADEWTVYGSAWGTRYDPALFGILNGGDEVDTVVKAIQETLLVAGYDPGPVDGIMGNRTKSAMVQRNKDAKAGGGVPSGEYPVTITFP